MSRHPAVDAAAGTPRPGSVAEPDLVGRRGRPSYLFLAVLAGLLVPALISAGLNLAGISAGALVQQGTAAALVAFLVIALVDLLFSLSLPAIGVERRMPANLSLDRDASVTLILSSGERCKLVLTIFDHVPVTVAVDGMPASCRLAPGEVLSVSYRIRPRVRGDSRFEGTEFRCRSRLGFWERQFICPTSTLIRVFPDFAALAAGGFSNLAPEGQHAGVRPRQRRGEGTEFHQLRDYRQGDLLRQVDWKATSRRGRLVAREYQQDRDQNLIVLLDCGNRMNTRGDDLSDFDYALNAALYLAKTALGQGDSVGMLSFGQQTRWVPPVKGVRGLSSLLNRFYDLYPGTLASDYILAAETLMACQRKRALVVLITNLRDADSPDLNQFVDLVAGRHLVLVASLREPLLDLILQGPVRDFEDALTLGSAAGFLQRRKQLEEQLRAQGVMLADVAPRELTATLVSRYLDIKRSRSL